MPTVKEKESVEERIRALRSETFRTQGGMMRPVEGRDGLAWDELSREQALDVLSSSVDWSGFDVEQQVEVSLRVADDDWDLSFMESIEASDQREHDRAENLERQTEEWFGRYGRLPEPGEVDRHDRELRAAREASPSREEVGGSLSHEAATVAFPNAELERMDLLLATHSLAREIGFVGFRAEFMNDPVAVEEWPDPADRERGLRDSWDEMRDFSSFETAHKDADLAFLTRLHGDLHALSGGSEKEQVEYYRQAMSNGRDAANDNIPGGDGKPPGGPPLSAYDRKLQEAAESGISHTMNQEKDNGRDR